MLGDLDDEALDRLIAQRFHGSPDAPAAPDAPAETECETGPAPEPEPERARVSVAVADPERALERSTLTERPALRTPASREQRPAEPHPFDRPREPIAVHAPTSIDSRIEGAPQPRTTRIGEILVAKGLVDDDSISAAFEQQQTSGKRLGALLVDAGAVSERDLVDALAEQRSMQTVDLRHAAPDPAAIALLGESSARDLLAIPLRCDGDRVEVAIADPDLPGLAFSLVEAIESPIRIVLAPESDLRRTIDASYRADAHVDDVVRVFEERSRIRAEQERARSVEQPVATVDENAPAVQVVNLILEQAVKDRASDVHIEPSADRLRIRNRTDGALHEVFSLPSSMAQSLVSRIKVMADLNIVERRRPQDGQIEVTVDGRELDIRVSTTSTVYGEKAVLRLLDKSRALYPLHELGMPDDLFASYYDLVRSPFGMVICAGPTGSGKTTTLYATLSEVNRDEINVMTIEDPVEYVHRHKQSVISQREIGWDTNSFARGLRAVLREDPDVVLVGEMRDPETIGIALTVAETGHLVFATLHTNDAAQAIDRVIDVFPAEQQAQIRVQLGASLQAVVAQRLVPRVAGGQVAAFEVLIATNPVKNLIREGKTHQIRNMLATGGRDGMQTMEAALSSLVRDGVISHADAVSRALRPDEIRT